MNIMDISNLIASLERGILPAELNYKPQEVTEIDWDKFLYNLRYHDPAFYDNKLPKKIKQIPAYDKTLNLIVEKNEDNSPLKEMDLRNNLNKDYIDDELVQTKQEASVCTRIYTEGDF